MGEGLVGALEESTLPGLIGHDCTLCGAMAAWVRSPALAAFMDVLAGVRCVVTSAFIVPIAPLLRWWVWLVGDNVFRQPREPGSGWVAWTHGCHVVFLKAVGATRQ